MGRPFSTDENTRSISRGVYNITIIIIIITIIIYIYIYIRSGPNNHDDHDSAIAEVSLWSKSGPKVAHRTA